MADSLKTILVSPSGHFYGSEQVLYDYLEGTKIKYLVFVPREGILVQRLAQSKGRHTIRVFRPEQLIRLYLRILYLLAFKGYTSLYVNEAAHIKYVEGLAKILTRKRFYIHVRILEDTVVGRLPARILSNLNVFTITKFIQSRVSYPSTLIYDGYAFKRKSGFTEKSLNSIFKIGMVGRISISKGIDHLLPILEIFDLKSTSDIQIHLFGSLDPGLGKTEMINTLYSNKKIRVMGFVERKDDIYGDMDCILHLAENEPLGRIYFEALDYGIPFIGFNSGGIGEMASRIDYTELLVEAKKPLDYNTFYEKIRYVQSNGKVVKKLLAEKRELATKIFSMEEYTSTLDIAVQMG